MPEQGHHDAGDVLTGTASAGRDRDGTDSAGRDHDGADSAGIGHHGADPLDLLRTADPGPVLDWQGVVARARERPMVVAVVAVAVLAAVGYVVLGGRGSSPPELSLPTLTTAAPPDSSAPPTSGTAPSSVLVHAAGAVTSPGVYELPAGSRLADLVAAAGGLTAEADADRVNLAAPLVDGQRVYVPRRGEPAVPEVVAGDGAPTGGEGAAPGDDGASRPDASEGSSGSGGSGDPVDVNTATLDELDTLPGVGPTTAQAIIDHRAANGPFRTVDDLLDVRGIGEAKLEQLRPLVSV